MSQPVTIELNGNEAGAVRAWLAVSRAAEGYSAKLAQLDDVQEKNTKSAIDWDRVAMRTLREIQTPQQRHNDKVKELNELLARGKLNQEQFAAATRKSQLELDKVSGAAGEGGGAADLLSTKLAGMATAAGGVMSIASVIKAEYQDLMQRQGKAGDSQVTLAAAQRSATMNLGADPSLDPKTMTEQLSAIAGQSGVPVEQATRVFSEMLSSRGSMPAADVLSRLQSVLEAAPDQSGLSTLGGATMSLGTEFGISGKESLGIMMQAQAASPVASLESLAQNSVGAMVSVSKFGDSLEQAAELVSTLASAAKDTRGADSGTASIQLAARLEKVLPKLGSTEERIAAVRGSTALQNKVFADEFGEAKYKPIFKELLKGAEDSPAVTAYRASQAAITSPKEAVPIFEELLRKYDELPLAQTAKAGRNLSAGADQLRTGDIFGGRSGVARKGLEEMLSAANIPKIDRDFTMTQFDMATQLQGSAPIGQAAALLEQKARARIAPVDVSTAPTVGFGGMTFSRQESRREATAEEKRVGEGMATVAKALRELQAAIEKNSRATDENTKTTAAPPANIRPDLRPSSPVPSAINDDRAQPYRP